MSPKTQAAIDSSVWVMTICDLFLSPDHPLPEYKIKLFIVKFRKTHVLTVFSIYYEEIEYVFLQKMKVKSFL